MSPLCIVFLSAFAGAIVLTPLARALARRLDAVDRPDGKRKMQKDPVPLWGGVAVYLSMILGLVVAAFVFSSVSAELIRLSMVVAAAAGFVCIFGCLDDSFDLGPRTKLLLQIASTLPVVLCGYYVDDIVLFGHQLELGWVSIPLTVIWLVACINAINLLDGMDGLASVVGISSAAMMALIAATSGSVHVSAVAMVLAGALAGFLAYNLPPASIYLGDSGSMVIGLVVGVLAIQGSLKSTATLSITVPAVIMTIPMLDTALAIARRRLSGTPIVVADRGHIHHRLLDRGLSKWQALYVIGALCMATGAAAAAATVFRSDALAWIMAISVVVLLVRTGAFGNHELALVKLAVANVMSRCSTWLVDSARSPIAASPESYARMTFNAAWIELAAEAARWNVQRMEWLVEHDGRRRTVREWILPSGTMEPCHQWTFAMRFTALGDELCELRVAGFDTSPAQPLHLLHLSRLLKSFGEYWATQSDGLGTTTLPIGRVEPWPEDHRGREAA